MVNARNLRALQVDTDWVSAAVSEYSLRSKFSIDDAREIMLKEDSQLRKIYISGVLYQVRGALIAVIQLNVHAGKMETRSSG